MISEDPLETTFHFNLSTRKKKKDQIKRLFILFDTGCNFHWKGYVNMAGKLPQLDCKRRASFAWNTNCVQCHPKRLLFHRGPAAIQSLNCFSRLTEDYLRARHSWQCHLPHACRPSWLRTRYASEVLLWLLLSKWSPAASEGTVMLSQLPPKPEAKLHLQRHFRLLQSSRLKVRRGPGPSVVVCFAHAVQEGLFPAKLPHSIILSLKPRLLCKRFMSYPV